MPELFEDADPDMFEVQKVHYLKHDTPTSDVRLYFQLNMAIVSNSFEFLEVARRIRATIETTNMVKFWVAKAEDAGVISVPKSAYKTVSEHKFPCEYRYSFADLQSFGSSRPHCPDNTVPNVGHVGMINFKAWTLEDGTFCPNFEGQRAMARLSTACWTAVQLLAVIPLYLAEQLRLTIKPHLDYWPDTRMTSVIGDTRTVYRLFGVAPINIGGKTYDPVAFEPE
ncbi:hypothetical protein BV898_18193 [Hypsibius exemplaris]|uniref:Uncharacterized protein n=1 Tax=Hypsibius exemplaris TaxID=2072580 RepID=A0A9X6NGS6_HYPEX|nr:hypothetical protein BV898_18193 [Hypsibius exemplaris]